MVAPFRRLSGFALARRCPGWVLLFLALSSAAPAAITLQSSSSSAATAVGGHAWSHPLAAGSQRMLLVGVAVEDGSSTEATVSALTAGGLTLTSVAKTKVTGGGSGKMQTEWFVALEVALPPSGDLPLTVTFSGTVDAVLVVALVLEGAAQSLPEAAATNLDTSGKDDLTSSISTLTHGAWVVDLIGSGNPGRFTPGNGQEEILDRDAGTVMSAAVSTVFVPGAGPRTMSWVHANANRLTHSLVSIAPAEAGPVPVYHALQLQTTGSGSITAHPQQTHYLAGSSVSLTAVPVAGWEFSGWSGDAAGLSNPLTVTMDAAKSITAQFQFVGGAPDVTLTVAITGAGTVQRQPGGDAYAPGTNVVLTAQPMEGWRFAGWTGGVAGPANPVTLRLDANTVVNALFLREGESVDFSLSGWATAGEGTTGGAGGETVVVTDYAGFVAAINTTDPLIIHVSGTIEGVGDAIRVQPHKSILGLGAEARFLNLGLTLGWNSAFGEGGNIIIRNITFDRVRAPTDKVAIAYGAKNVWVDHCVFLSDRENGEDYYDGQLDITHGADYITVSWCQFVDHAKNSLIGHTENNAAEDAGHLTATYHHNAFLRTNSRNPSVRYGTVHVYNNYYQDISDYGIASRQNAQVVIEHNYFKNVLEPINADTNLSSVPGFVRGTATNFFENCGPNSIITAEATWMPPYAYTLDPVLAVPALVLAYSGVGVIDPTAPPMENQPPTILVEPTDLIVNYHATGTFSVVAKGSSPLSYQWRLDGVDIPGATHSTYHLADVQEKDVGTYQVMVSNPYGQVLSRLATLQITDQLFLPVLDPQPVSVTAPLGDTVVLSVGVTGSPPFSYQWYQGGQLIAGALADTLTIAHLSPADAGYYWVVVTNPAGQTTSSQALLAIADVLVPPRILYQSGHQFAVAGSTVVLSIALSGGALDNIVWKKDGIVLPEQHGLVLALTNISASQAGSYTVEVSNPAGRDQTTPMIVTVGQVPSGSDAILFVAPDGLDTAPGTLENPLSLQRAIERVPPGGTIYLRGGTYQLAQEITIARSNSGQPGLPKRLMAMTLPDGTTGVPVLDFSRQPYGKTSQVSNPRGLWVGGSWWHLKGLIVHGAADNGILICGNHNIVERCVTRFNRDTGLQIARYSSSAPRSEWPSHNLVIHCDSHDNFDHAPNAGENADGFAAKLTSGPGNRFHGCIAHHNIDDGWDLYTKSETGPIDPVLIDSCLSYRNGILSDGTSNEAGDRNGFKLGGEKISVVHTITRCLAFQNGKNGFTWNSNPAALRVFHNFAFDNAEGNFKFDQPGPVFLNNISLWTTSGAKNDRYGGNSGIATGPSNLFWYVGSKTRGPSLNDAGLKVTAASFRSLTPPAGGFSRHPDGRIDLGDFARLVDGSLLIDAGASTTAHESGLYFDPALYYDQAPDIGPREEYPASPPRLLQPLPDLVAVSGQTVDFSVTVAGTPPFLFTWKFQQTVLQEAAQARLLLPFVTSADSGYYHLTVTNAHGSVESGPIALLVDNAPPSGTFLHWLWKSGLPESDWRPEDDPDQNGLSHLLEYALGYTHPGAASGQWISPHADSSEFVVEIPSAAQPADVLLEFWVSPDLLHWQSIGQTPGASLEAGPDRYRVRLPLNPGGTYLRLRARLVTP